MILDPNGKTVVVRALSPVFGIEAFGDRVDTRLALHLREIGVTPVWFDQPRIGHYRGYFREEDREVVSNWLEAQGAVYQEV